MMRNERKEEEEDSSLEIRLRISLGTNINGVGDLNGLAESK